MRFICPVGSIRGKSYDELGSTIKQVGQSPVNYRAFEYLFLSYSNPGVSPSRLAINFILRIKNITPARFMIIT